MCEKGQKQPLTLETPRKKSLCTQLCPGPCPLAPSWLSCRAGVPTPCVCRVTPWWPRGWHWVVQGGTSVDMLGDRTGGQQRREDRKARTDRTNVPHCFTALPAGLRQPHVRTQASLLATSCLGGKPGVLEHASTAGSSTHCFLPPAQASGTFSLPT